MPNFIRTRIASSLSRAACAVAVASAVGGGALARGGETEALEQIQKYCTTSWQRAGIARQEWEDCTQGALARLLERVPRDALAAAMGDKESRERRELNRAIWTVVQRVKRQQRLKFTDVAATPDREASSREAWQEVLRDGRSSLTPRQFQVLELAGDGWSIAEIGENLDLSPSRASDEKYKAIRKLRQEAEA